MNLSQIAESRYATKKFDPEQKIPDAIFDQIKALLRLSPSSVNSQPWHFVLAANEQAKSRMAKGTQGPYNSNESKVLNASHVILFCVKTELSDDYLQHLLDNEDKDGRFPQPESKGVVHKTRAFYADLHRKQRNDTQHWMEKQVYLNMGSILLAAGVLGIDAVPIEGIDTEALDHEFNLIERGYKAVSMVALGYRDNEDFNAKLPKSRLPEAEIFTQV